MILERVIPAEHLTLLREECAYFLGYMDARMDAGLVGEGALSVRRNRYFVNSLYRYSDRLHEFLFSDLMADICRATVGDDAILFNEQWVVKGAEQGMNFAWHQDSGYVLAEDPGTDHQPYVTCWCTLDDVNEENGTVYLLPHSTAGTLARSSNTSATLRTTISLATAGMRRALLLRFLQVLSSLFPVLTCIEAVLTGHQSYAVFTYRNMQASL